MVRYIVNIKFKFQMAELLVTGALFMFSTNTVLAWVLLSLGLVGAMVRTAWEKAQEEEQKKERSEQWETLRRQLLQAQISTVTVPDDDLIKH